MMDMEFVENNAVVTDHKYVDKKDISPFQQRMEHEDSMQSGFNIGWVETDEANMCRKRKTKRKTSGADLGLNRPTQEEGARPKGTWTRISRLAMGKEETLEQKKVPKRKNTTQNTEEGLMQEKEKRVRLEEEIKNFNMLLALEFGSAEVTKPTGSNESLKLELLGA